MSEEYSRYITEQAIEKEVVEDIRYIVDDGIEYIEEVRTTTNDYIKATAKSYIIGQEDDDVDSVIEIGKKINGDIHFEDEDVVDEVISNTDNKGVLGNNYIETKGIYNETLEIVSDTENEIEYKIRTFILNEKGYTLKYSNDGYGNANIVIEEAK